MGDYIFGGLMQHRRTANSLLYTNMFLSAALMTVISAMLGSVADEFSLSMSQSGLFYLIQFSGFTLFIFLAGIISDKVGKRIVLTVIFVVLIASLFAFSLSRSYIMSLAIVFFAGGFSGPLESVTLSMISDVNGVGAEKQINISGIFYGLGAMAGPVLAGVFLHFGVSWRMVYIALALICIVMLGVSYFLRIPKVHHEDKISFVAFKKIATDWRFMLICFCVFLYCGAEGAAWGWMAEYMKVNLGFQVLKQSFAIGAFWMAIVVGRFIVTQLHNRVSPRVIIAVLAAGAASASFAAAYVSSEAFAWIIAILMGLFYSSLWPVMVGQALGRHKQFSGTSSAIAVSSGGLALGVVPSALGAVADKFGVFVAQIIPSFFFVVILVVFYFIARPEKKII
jgi:fucose permease